jgi:hypothetical protein
MSTGKQKPVHEIRIGAIKAAIWQNRGADGRTRYNATVSRIYRDGEGKDAAWKSTDSFGRDDLLVLAKVADLAHTWISTQPSDQSGE